MTPVEPTLLSTVQGVSLSNLLAGTTTPLFSGTLTVSLVSTGTSTPPYAGSSAPPFPPRQRPTSHLLLSLSAPDNLGEPLYELLVSPSSTVLKLPPSRFLLPIEQGVADDDERGFLQITLVEPDDFFESVLLGFTAPVTPPPMEQELEGADPELRSKLFLVDEDQTIVGELATGIEMTEDPALVKTSMEPVVVDFGAQGAVGTRCVLLLLLAPPLLTQRTVTRRPRFLSVLSLHGKLSRTLQTATSSRSPTTSLVESSSAQNSWRRDSRWAQRPLCGVPRPRRALWSSRMELARSAFSFRCFGEARS